MGLEELMARAKARARAHAVAARHRRVQRLHDHNREIRRRPTGHGKRYGAGAILKFAAVSCKINTQGQQMQIPGCVLDMVMSKLASCLEPGGVYGPALVARDLANASLVCSEFYMSARHGLSVLSALVQQQLQQQLHKQPLPPAPSAWLGEKAKAQYAAAESLSGASNLPGPLGWGFWERVITDPLSIPLHDLETAARQMGIIELAPVPASAAAAAVPGAAAPQQVPAADGAWAQAAEAAGNAAAAAASHEGMPSPPAAATAKANAKAAAAATKCQARLIRRLLECCGLSHPLPAAATAPAQVATAADEASATAAAASSTAPAGSAASPAATAAAAVHGSAVVSHPRAALLRAVALERCCPIIAWDGPDRCAALFTAVKQLAQLRCNTVARANLQLAPRGCLSSMRAELAAAGVTSMQQLQVLLAQEKAAAEIRKQQRQHQKEREKQLKEQKKRAAAAALSPPPKKGRAFSFNSISIKPNEDDHMFI